MIGRLQRLSKEINKRGLLGGINWMFNRIWQRIIPQRIVIWFTDLMEINGEAFSLPDNVEITRYTREDEIEHCDYKRLVETRTELMGSNPIEFIKKRFSYGAQLWIIKVNGQFAGYHWTIVKDPLEQTFFPHTERDVNAIGVEIFEEFRGQGLYKILNDFMVITLKKEGFSRFYRTTYVWNKSSISAISKTHRKIGIARRFSIFGINNVLWYEMSNKLPAVKG